MGWGQRLEDGTRAAWAWLVAVVTWRKGPASLLFVALCHGALAALALWAERPVQESALLSVASAFLVAEVASWFLGLEAKEEKAEPLVDTDSTPDKPSSAKPSAAGLRDRSRVRRDLSAARQSDASSAVKRDALSAAKKDVSSIRDPSSTRRDTSKRRAGAEDTKDEITDTKEEEAPVNGFLYKILLHVWGRLTGRTAELGVVGLCGSAYACLLEDELRHALCLALGALWVGLAALPWRSHGLTQRIWTRTCRLGTWIRRRILRPLWRFVCWCARIARYWLFGEWIPPLCRTIRDTALGIYHWVLDSIVHPTVRLAKAVWAGLLYVVLLKWVPPLLRWIRDTILGWANWFNEEIVQPIWRLVKRVWAAFTYVVLLKWVPPLLAYVNRKAVQPTIRGLVWLRDSLVWVVTGGWVPPLLQWIREVKERGVEKVYETLENTKASVLRGRDAAVAYVKQTIADLRRWVWECVVGARDWVRDEVVRPFAAWCVDSARRIRRWLMDDVLKPAWRLALLGQASTGDGCGSA